LCQGGGIFPGHFGSYITQRRSLALILDRTYEKRPSKPQARTPDKQIDVLLLVTHIKEPMELKKGGYRTLDENMGQGGPNVNAIEEWVLF